MNNHIIYLEDAEIKAKSFLSRKEYDTFVASLPVESILLKDGVVTVDSISKEKQELFHSFFKIMKRNWDMTQVIFAPKETVKRVNEPGVDIVITDTPEPKKRGRKKKEAK